MYFLFYHKSRFSAVIGNLYDPFGIIAKVQCDLFFIHSDYRTGDHIALFDFLKRSFQLFFIICHRSCLSGNRCYFFFFCHSIFILSLHEFAVSIIALFYEIWQQKIDGFRHKSGTYRMNVWGIVHRKITNLFADFF